MKPHTLMPCDCEKCAQAAFERRAVVVFGVGLLFIAGLVLSMLAVARAVMP